MKVGYCRVSTLEQEAGFDAQLRDLRDGGCEKVFSEKISGLIRERPQLNAALSYMREGDELVCTKLDRLARDLGHLFEISNRLDAMGCGLVVLDIGIDTTTPVGRLMLVVLGGIAEFEVAMMKMRQAEGISAARAAGKYKGSAGRSRKGKEGKAADLITDVLIHDDMRDSMGKRKYTRDEIATICGTSRRQVFRILSDAGRTGSRIPVEAENVG